MHIQAQEELPFFQITLTLNLFTISFLFGVFSNLVWVIKDLFSNLLGDKYGLIFMGKVPSWYPLLASAINALEVSIGQPDFTAVPVLHKVLQFVCKGNNCAYLRLAGPISQIDRDIAMVF
jgi:hypothetical protein